MTIKLPASIIMIKIFYFRLPSFQRQKFNTIPTDDDSVLILKNPSRTHEFLSNQTQLLNQFPQNIDNDNLDNLIYEMQGSELRIFFSASTKKNTSNLDNATSTTKT